MEKSGGMSDAQIKLFGKTIQLGKPINTHFGSAFSDDCEPKKQNLFSHEIAISSCSASAAVRYWNRDGDLQEHGKKRSESIITETRKANDSSIPISEEFKDPTTLLENPRIPPIETEPDSTIDIKNSQQSENNSENTPRKPDKILPCQRCNSMDTKFCYYNNYNISQPRHFCKKCQRYWTAGGTMRNVPVGSGRRKNKKKAFASHCRHIMVSEALQATQANGRVLSFGSSFGEKSWKCSEDGYYGPEKKHFSPCGGGENGDDHSSKSSITAADSAESGGKGNSAFSESVWSNFQTLPGPPWHFPWNFSVTLHQKPSYWGSTLPGSWNFPCFSPSNEGFKPLGKLSTDGEMLRNSEEKPLTENYVWNPKTLRIDDPYEAATSSTWSTLGSKNERNDLIKEKGLFKAFESKENMKVETAKTNLVLQANPAALCRLLNFHENA